MIIPFSPIIGKVSLLVSPLLPLNHIFRVQSCMYTVLYMSVRLCMYVCIMHYTFILTFLLYYIHIFGTNILTSCLQESNEALLVDFQRNLLQRERELKEIRSMGTRGAQVRVCCY